MSRSSNPNPAANHPLPGAPEHDPQAWQTAARGYRQPQQPAFGQQDYAPQGEPAADPYAQPGYHYPQQGAPQAAPYAQTPQPAPRQPSPYDALQQDRYAAPPQAQPPAPPQPQRAYGGQGYAAQPVEPTLGRGPELRPTPYDTWQAAPQDQHRGGLSSYQPAAGPQLSSYDASRQSSHSLADAPLTADWGAHDPYAGHVEPSLGPAPYADHGGQPAGLEQTYAEDEAAYEPAEPRRGRKLAIILAGAMLVGGGLAYAYSALLGPSSDGATPVVKSASGPFKVKPSDPGGKQFAHTDSKIMGRLGEGGAASDGSPAADGSRKVSTLVVGPDGSIQAPPAQPEPPQQTALSVPGLTVIDGFGGPPPGAVAPPAAQPAASAPDAAPSAPAVKKVATAAEPEVVNSGTAKKPVVIAKVTPAAPTTTQSIADEAPAGPASPARPTRKVAAATPPAAAAAPAAPATSSGAGYVAVLASVPASGSSRMDALAQFADMQQKYGSILNDKTPDVQEATVSGKGTYHRLLVGPPGSRSAANEVCTQLKAQGYSGCWVTSY